MCGGCRRVGCDRGLSVVRARPWLARGLRFRQNLTPLDPTPETWEALRQARDFLEEIPALARFGVAPPRGQPPATHCSGRTAFFLDLWSFFFLLFGQSVVRPGLAWMMCGNLIFRFHSLQACNPCSGPEPVLAPSSSCSRV